MTSSLVFKVRRSAAVAVKPARPTPIEVKPLSDWDNKSILGFQSVSVILLYKNSAGAADQGKKDPAEIIRKALAEALVYYYPWAGRLKKGSDGKLVVDCTVEGVLFVEADASVRLDQFGEDSLQPPFPCIDDLLYNYDSTLIDPMPALGSPLFTMQVTRLLCGGFILGFTFDHVISDAFGAALFLTAIAELAGGAPTPSVLPVWRREEFLNARDPPDHVPPTSTLNVFDDKMVKEDYKPATLQGDNGGSYRSFFFGAREVAAIRACIPERLQQNSTSFELIVACILHCRITTLQHKPEQQVRVVFPINCRDKFVERPIPAGYYGNVSFFATFVCPMQDLHDLGCAVLKVKRAKESVNEGYVQSMLDIEVIRRRSSAPNIAQNCTTYSFNDWSRVGFSTIDFQSWGKPVFVGKPYNGRFRHVANFMVSFMNEKGEEGRLVNLYMSKDAMDKFSFALSTLLEFK